MSPALAGRFFTTSTTWESPRSLLSVPYFLMAGPSGHQLAPLSNPSSDLSSFFTQHTTYYLFKDHIRSCSSNPKHPGMGEWAYKS